MGRVGAIGGGAGTPRRAARPAGGFAACADPAAAGVAGGGAAGAVAALFAAWQGASPEVAERRAHRAAGEALESLRALQLGLLRGAAGSARIAVPDAAAITDLGLRDAVAQVALRVRVEEARARHNRGLATGA